MGRGRRFGWVAAGLVLLLALAPPPIASAAESVGVVGKILFANGLPLLAVEAENGTLLLLDNAPVGTWDGSDVPVDLTALCDLTGDTTKGYNLSEHILFGGGYEAEVAHTRLTILGGTLNHVYGGGYQGAVTGDSAVYMSGGAVRGNLSAGGTDAAVTGRASLALTGGAVGGDGGDFTVSGGGLGDGARAGSAELSIGGDAVVIATVCGGGAESDAATGSTFVSLAGEAEIRGDVFGGGLKSAVTGAASVGATGTPTVTGNLSGGSYQADCGSSSVSLQGITVAGTVRGGGSDGSVAGAVSLQVLSGAQVGGIVGGCENGAVGGAITLLVDGARSGRVIGGCLSTAAQPTMLANSITLTLQDTTLGGDVIGGSLGAHHSGLLKMKLLRCAVAGDVTAGPSGTAGMELQGSDVLLELEETDVVGSVGIGGNARLSGDATLLFWSGSAARFDTPAREAAAGSLIYLEAEPGGGMGNGVALGAQSALPRNTFVEIGRAHV